jgi:glycerol-3-phosphate O-acyltransferase
MEEGRVQNNPAECVSPDAAWPSANAERVVFLLDCAGSIERRILERWIDAHRPPNDPHDRFETAQIPCSRSPRARSSLDPAMEHRLATHDDPLMAPLRIAWISKKGVDAPPPHLLSLLAFGDPYDPGRIRQWWISKRMPERALVVAGEPAHLSELRRRWLELGGQDRTDTTGLAEFVARQASLALDRAERRIRGMRYKVPRFVDEEILDRPAFRGGIARMAWETGRSTAEVGHEAANDLSEIAAMHSPYLIDLSAQFCRFMYSRGYGETLQYDRKQFEEIYTLAQRNPVVFLPSHKSNLDHAALLYALYENGHPPNHTAGGINMNFFPLGTLMRRSGVFFIRRSFKGNRIYKFVLGQYVDYLIEKRFPLEWYIEGGRSRSGKLLPPRFGMLSFVVDAYRRGKSEDVYLLPVSIAYDQIQDVGSYATEQRGGEKETEGVQWLFRMFRMLRRKYGRIYLEFGQPISLREAMGPPDPNAEPNADEKSLELQKLAFEVSVRINRVTPLTPTSLVTLALLGAGDRALTIDETVAEVDVFTDYVLKRSIPTTVPFKLNDVDSVQKSLDSLIENGVVSGFSDGPEAVYAIHHDQHHIAAYYRNTIIHFFLNGAIVELSLLRASEDAVEDRENEFHEETLRLRDLLKFDFFFPDKDEFAKEIVDEMDLHHSEWHQFLAGNGATARELLHQIRPFTAYLILRPFFEAYRVVADALTLFEFEGEFPEKEFFSKCLALGRQYHLQRRIRSAESVSKVFFATALRLARNRGLVENAGPGGDEARRAFADELAGVTRRLDAVDALAAGRRAGLIG